MTELEQLRSAMAALEAQRVALGDAVDALIAFFGAREASEADAEKVVCAGRLSNSGWRQSFLENVAENRAIVELRERMNEPDVPGLVQS